MNKKTYILIAVVAVVVLLGGTVFYSAYIGKKDSHGCLVNRGFAWCDAKNECAKAGTENCSLTVEAVIGEVKKAIGLDLNVMKGMVKYNIESGNVALDGKGCYYSDALKAEKTIKGFSDLDNLFKERGFNGDSFNQPVDSDEKNSRIYKKDNIVCQLDRIDNPNSTTSLSVFCAYEKDAMCNFSDESCGTKCENDSDCGVLLDACKRKTVCRNINFKFYNDCSDPSTKVNDISFGINRCKCSNNQCIVKFSDE